LILLYNYIDVPPARCPKGMPAFLRVFLLQAVLLLQAILLLLRTILGKQTLAFMMIRPCLPTLIIFAVAMIPLPKLPAMVAQPLLAVRSFITHLSSDLTNSHSQLVPTVVLERESAEIPVPLHPSVSSRAKMGRYLIPTGVDAD
jgi:hypothetical protein